MEVKVEERALIQQMGDVVTVTTNGKTTTYRVKPGTTRELELPVEAPPAPVDQPPPEPVI